MDTSRKSGDQVMPSQVSREREIWAYQLLLHGHSVVSEAPRPVLVLFRERTMQQQTLMMKIQKQECSSMSVLERNALFWDLIFAPFLELYDRRALYKRQ